MTRYYHGTVADLQPGDLITPGHGANYVASKSGRVYFTTDRAWALLYALDSSAEDCPPRVYEVRPTASRTFHDFGLFLGVIRHQHADRAWLLIVGTEP